MKLSKLLTITSVLTLTLLAANAKAEWTGDSDVEYYSNQTIIDIHTGQIDTSPYFCIKSINNSSSSSTPLVTCSIKNQSKWNVSYETLLDQAKLFYTTGQPVRIYFQRNVWTNTPFINAFSSNVIAGLSSCSDSTSTSCFGPLRQ